MKIIFFGTPDFAIPSLKILHQSENEVVAVVTAPDKQRGRGRKLSFTPIKQYAVDNNIPVLQPEKMKDPIFIEALKSYNADLFVIVAFRILPAEVFTMPTHGSFNLHGSLLPKYRGAAPIQWAIINGDNETGATTFFLKEKVDTGNIIMQETMPIDEDENLESVHDRMSEMGSQLVLKTVDMIKRGIAVAKPQDNTLASPAPKITKETCKISWNKKAIDIKNLIRGLSPFPGAFFIYNEKQYKVFASNVIEEKNLNVGEIEQTKKEIFIGTEENALQILEIQPEGRKRMTAEEFLRGYTLI